MSDKIKSMSNVLCLLGEHLEALRPVNSPTQAQINAAKAASSMADSYVEAVLLCMEYSKKGDEYPGLDFMKIDNKSK